MLILEVYKQTTGEHLCTWIFNKNKAKKIFYRNNNIITKEVNYEWAMKICEKIYHHYNTSNEAKIEIRGNLLSCFESTTPKFKKLKLKRGGLNE